MAATQIPSSHKALVFTSHDQPLEVVTRPVPTPTSGSAIIRVSMTGVLSYTGEVYSGKRLYDYPSPHIPGSAAVGHIVALGDDATTLKVGDHVFFSMFLYGRDNRDARALQGLHQGGSSASASMVQKEFHDGTYCEYSRAPLESIVKLPETPQRPDYQWLHMARLLVPFGGLTNNGGVDLRPGETIVVAPATGQFSGSAVEMALAMGARVVALGRSADGLNRLRQGLAEYGDRLRTVSMSGDIDTDRQAIGPVDCYIDISPPFAAKSTHIKACILALKPRGRACFMGGIKDDISIPHGMLYRNNLMLMGKWMFEQDAPKKVLSLVEGGMLRLDRQKWTVYSLEQWKEAFDNAAEKMRWDDGTALKLH